ncbi:hypothetical protein BDR04DRAFT_1105347 [Suillus decipiens]|nr:hypothetical protein BDR04DRAFT_1105347 [Suillus decipiens]
MQLTLLASLAVLCGAAFAAPSKPYGTPVGVALGSVGGDSSKGLDRLHHGKEARAVVEAIADVQNDVNNAEVEVASPNKRENPNDIQGYVDGILVNEFAPIHGPIVERDNAVVNVDADVQNDVNDAKANVASPHKRVNPNDLQGALDGIVTSELLGAVLTGKP